MDRCLLVLVELCRRLKSESDSLSISSSELGSLLGISQQSASRYLSELERRGFIFHSGRRVSLTSEGVSLLRELYLCLHDFFESSLPLVVEGRVVSGIGEGAYYVCEYSPLFEKQLGFKPFFGTLNLQLIGFCPSLERFVSGVIKPFRRGDRMFGEVKYIPVSLIGDSWYEDCFLILPKRTHHKKELEIIARENLREKHKLKDGDTLKVEIKDISPR
ncbi:MAG: DUF120 domain-containing protein [Candidatus Altiarchaeota archaeon]|nr:DUF120 domain-containing protein [Candidatus Altiarchaeota archaeon]